MTHLPTLIRTLACGALIASPAAVAPSALAQTPSPSPTPDAAPELLSLGIQGVTVPEDVRNYSSLSGFASRTPMLAPDGSLTWFYSRQRSADDGRALGTISLPATQIGMRANSGAAVSDTIRAVFGSVPGTTGLRVGRDYDARDNWYSLGAATTAAVAWRGANWILDRRATPRPTRTALVSLRDGVGGRVERRYGPDFFPTQVIPTDRGLRTVGELTVKAGNRRIGVPAITPPGSVRPVRIKVVGSIAAVAPLPGGRLLVTGSGTVSTLPDPVVIVDPRGGVRRLADRRSPTAAFATGRSGVAALGADVLLGEGSGDPGNGPRDFNKGALVVRDATGKVKLRRLVADLDYPGGKPCQRSGVHYDVLGVQSGPDGLPIATIACGASVSGFDGETSFRWLQVNAVGLTRELDVRWWRRAGEYDASYPWSAPIRCGSESTLGSGRLAIVMCASGGSIGVMTHEIPGVGTPPAGRMARSSRVGKQSVRARIVCRGPVGTVCSGTARVTANGQPLGSADYVVPARPGALQGELDRQIETTVPLPKRYSVTLTPRA